jgi:phosphatidylglycerophosphatase A
LLRIIATGLGTGFLPIAPGTWGSILAVVIYAAVPGFAPAVDEAGIPNTATILAILLAAAIAVPAATATERELGHDAGPIVIDEVVGQWITLAGLAATPMVLIAGLFLFRVFDVFKPFPAGRSQRLPGGWGVLADDVIAGIYAAIALRLLLAILS